MSRSIIFSWHGPDNMLQYRASRDNLSSSCDPRWVIEKKHKDAMGKPSWQVVSMPYWLPELLDMLDMDRQAKKG